MLVGIIKNLQFPLLLNITNINKIKTGEQKDGFIQS